MTLAERPTARAPDLDPVKPGFTMRGWLLIAMVALLVNLPIVHSTWTQWRVARSGTDVTATVTDTGVLPPMRKPQYVVAFAFPKRVDPEQRRWTARVDRAAYDRAVDERTIEVRVLEGRPAAYRADGQVTSPVGIVITLVADLGLLLMVLFAARHRGRFRPCVRLVAIGDVERCAPGSSLERVEGDLYLARGEVAEIHDDHIVLDLGDHNVAVLLDGHLNPVGHQQPAEVRGRMIG